MILIEYRSKGSAEISLMPLEHLLSGRHNEQQTQGYVQGTQARRKLMFQATTTAVIVSAIKSSQENRRHCECPLLWYLFNRVKFSIFHTLLLHFGRVSDKVYCFSVFYDFSTVLKQQILIIDIIVS